MTSFSIEQERMVLNQKLYENHRALGQAKSTLKEMLETKKVYLAEFWEFAKVARIKAGPFAFLEKYEQED